MEEWVELETFKENPVVTILAFTFNTESVRICGSLNEERRCDVANFWPEFVKIIDQTRPTIVAIGFQEDVYPGSFFHSELLPREMSRYNYDLFNRSNLMGMGKTTVTGLKSGDLFARGLRMSTYLNRDAKDSVFQEHPHESYHSSLFRNKGAISTYLTLPNRTRLAIINTHLPFNAESIVESVEKRDKIIRMNSVAEQNVFFNKAYRKLVFDSPARPHYVIFMGDLNYRMLPIFGNWSAEESGELILKNPGDYREYDELTIEMRGGNIYPMKEGNNDIGPTFSPTCKMRKGRYPEERAEIEDYNTGKYDARTPSFCDRILYQTYGEVPDLVCYVYDRFDEGIMNKSDHAGVYGFFSFI